MLHFCPSATYLSAVYGSFLEFANSTRPLIVSISGLTASSSGFLRTITRIICSTSSTPFPIAAAHWKITSQVFLPGFVSKIDRKTVEPHSNSLFRRQKRKMCAFAYGVGVSPFAIGWWYHLLVAPISFLSA